MKKTLCNVRQVRCLALAALAAGALAAAQAQTVGLNFVGSGSSMTEAGGAFGVPLANWNNLSGASGSTTLSVSSGGGLTVTWSTGGGTWLSRPPFPGFSAGENEVFSGNLFAHQGDASGSINVTVSGLDTVAAGEYTLQLMAGIDGPRTNSRFREALVNGTTPLFFNPPTPAASGTSIAAATTNLTLSGDSFSFTLANDNPIEGGVQVRADLSGLTLAFTPLPGPTIVAPPPSQTVPEGFDAEFTLFASGAEPLSYQWQFNGADLLGETFPTLTVFNATAANAGSYRCVVTDANGRFALSTAQLFIAAAGPLLGYDPATITSAGAEGYGGGLANFFEVVAGTSVEVSDLGAVLYEATLTNTLTVQLYRSVGATVLATTTLGAGDASTPAASNPALNLYLKPLASPLRLGPGAYAIAIYGNTAGARVPRTPVGVTVNPSGAIHHLGSRYGNFEGPGVLPGVPDGTGFQYLAGTFTVAVSGAPAIYMQPQGGNVPEGGRLTLSVQAGGSLPLAYQWVKGATDLDGATSSTLVLSGLTVADAGDYRVRISNNLGDLLSDAATVNVAGQPAGTVASHAAILVQGLVGMHYRVEFREAVAPPGAWQLLQDIPALPQTPYQVFDPTPATGAQRFYRAQLTR